MMKQLSRRLGHLGLVVLVLGLSCLSATGQDSQAQKNPADWLMKNERLKDSHSKYPILQQDFKSGDDITKACLSCHTHADEDFRKTIHWTWLVEGPDKDTPVGKAGYSLNNFCISTNKMNSKSCLDCHTGWKGKEGQINCLACHGQKDFNFSEAFDDIPSLSAQNDPESKEIVAGLKTDMRSAVQAVISPERKNCGACHFNGGGGNGVKHGDLDTSMTNPPRDLDVHMSPDGGNFACTRCHTTRMHAIAGRVYTSPASTTRKSLLDDDLTQKITCESCHSSKPHKSNSKLNDHTAKVACQTCHIPTFARGGLPTKVWWDWSKAGVLKDGQKIKTEDYMTIKGEMRWAKNVKPTYYWYNGTVKTLTLKDTIDPSTVVKINQPLGDMNDPRSRISPFKLFRGKQPYDTKTNKLLSPLLSGKEGYWETLDWKSALTKGMEFMGMPFSGEWGFVETSSVLPTTHMVAPKEKALTCIECHNKHGRMEALTGFYMPGTGRSALVNHLGWLLVAITLIGVLGHGLLRMVAKGRNGRTS
jgi:octaheme c-type cytochrome (tetrathionate reductase family)